MENGIAFKKVVKAAIAWDLKFWTNTESRAFGFCLSDGGQDPGEVTLKV
jgi:hypothetical protein